jgi:hypothetical protein
VSGVELIVAALAAGATAGVTSTASSAVQDAYTGLKSLLVGWLGGDREAVEALRADETQPGVWQASLGDDLSASGVAGDEEVLAAARRLLGLVDPDLAGKYQVDLREAKGVIVGDHNRQTNTFS